MKRLLKNKGLVLLMLVALTLAAINCGYIMHPERRGQNGGRIDATSLVLDCLWFFVGVIPGVVALAVDFSTGGIYESGTAMNAAPGQKFTFRLRGPAPQDAEVAVTIQDQDGRVVSLLDRNVAQGEKIGPMEFALPAELAAGKYSLSLTVNDNPEAEWSLLVASAQK
ncbi:MAG: hypothetical protein A2V67_01100 [Deltaproteobacteria bacterium RBG_13_61_14]|nr:MAG: hypothetical protein A2V67_01100 [Deltaproteobacteria bacterium RBG_13_61_14]